MNGIRYVGARRGVFGLDSWAPLRAPGKPEALPVNVLNNNDKQSVNAPRSPLSHAEQHALQQQQQLYAAQSTVVPGRTAEQIANSAVENANAFNSRELFVSCFH